MLGTGVAVEKLAHFDFAEIASRQEALQSIFPSALDIFYHPICDFFQKNRLFQQPPLFSTVIWKVRPAIEPMSTPVPSGYSGFAERTSDLRTISHRPPTMPL